MRLGTFAAAVAASAAVLTAAPAAAWADGPGPGYTTPGSSWDNTRPAAIELRGGAVLHVGPDGRAELCKRTHRRHHRGFWRCWPVQLSGSQWHPGQDGGQQRFTGQPIGGQQPVQQFTYTGGWQQARR